MDAIPNVRVVRGIATVTLLLGLSVLGGWIFGVEFLKRMGLGLPPMDPDTALGFVLAAFGLGSVSLSGSVYGSRWGTLACGAALVAMGLPGLISGVLGFDLSPAQPASGTAAGGQPPVKMSPAAGVGFVAVGAALILFLRRRRSSTLVAQSLAVLALAVGSLALLGYAYRVLAFYGLSPLAWMALHSAGGFVLVSVGLLAVEPRTGIAGLFTSASLGGRLARELLPAVAIIVFVLALLRLWGERAGLYDPAVGTAALTLADLLLLTGLIAVYARTIARAESEREQAREEARLALVWRAEELEQRVAKRTAELSESASQLRVAGRLLCEAEHRERERIAHVLHENLQQILVAANMALQVQEDGQDATERARWLIHKAIECSRTLAVDLYPPVLYSQGLASALHWLAWHFHELNGLEVHVEADEGTDPISSETRSFLFQVARELLLNTVKHAGAEMAWLRLRQCGGEITVEVEDQGAGFDGEKLRRTQGDGDHFGLPSIRQRAVLLGGRVETEGRGGCRVAVTVPLGPVSDETSPTTGARQASG